MNQQTKNDMVSSAKTNFYAAIVLLFSVPIFSGQFLIIVLPILAVNLGLSFLSLRHSQKVCVD